MTPYFDEDGVTLYCGDCLDVLPTLGAQRFVVATDPPYSLGLSSAATYSAKSASWGDLLNAARWYGEWIAAVKRLTAPNGAAFVCSGWRGLTVLTKAVDLARWSIESLVVWDRGYLGFGGRRGLRQTYETVALLAHPGFAVADRTIGDVWRIKDLGMRRAKDADAHPAEKPIELWRRMVTTLGPGVVLDPFAGAGGALVAARLEGRQAVGVEIDERYCELAAKRLRREAAA